MKVEVCVSVGLQGRVSLKLHIVVHEQYISGINL